MAQGHDDEATDRPVPNLDDALDDDNFRRRLLTKVTRRLQNPRELGGDAMELMGALLETSDRAKSEMVKMVAREVRNYLEELKLHEDMRDLLLSHSLEVKMSLSLKPLADAASDDAAEPPQDGEDG